MIVLDTHIFIWYALNDPRLDEGLRLRMENDPRAVYLPSICLWEALLLIEKGRLKINAQNPRTTLVGCLKQSGFNEAPLTAEIAVLSRTLAFSHDDPADRFIAATAFALGAELATSDTRLRGLSWVRLAC
jgi:PIN domain nuclease of toxin-antitoxin system